MKKINTINITFFLTFLFVSTKFGQTNSNLDYFPYNEGDMWEYFYSDGPMYLDTAQVFNHYDSTDAAGNIYVTQTSRYINPISTPAIPFPDTMRYKIDTLNQVWGRVSELDNVIAFKLNAKQGDQWVLKTFYDNEEIMGHEMARVIFFDYEIFGKAYKVMNTVYFFTPDSTDTLGLSTYSESLMLGIGRFWKGGGESPGRMDLIGAVINGILYGDTTNVLTSINPNNNLPAKIMVKQNYPNPFNLTTKISYQLPEKNFVTLKVYDILGREIEELVNRSIEVGNHEAVFNANNLSSGIYYYQIKAGNFVQSRKMILIK